MFYGSLKVYEAIRMSPRPVIAAVNGAAAGGGNELVVACDIAIASDRATFGQTGVRVGSAPVLGARGQVLGVISLADIVSFLGSLERGLLNELCERTPARWDLANGLPATIHPEDAVLLSTPWLGMLGALLFPGTATYDPEFADDTVFVLGVHGQVFLALVLLVALLVAGTARNARVRT